ncbi:unnamed protein product (macronuclear) [Paramecium tetraurelia]|uniref:Uncharacterized protein n=1 Tax=Paramecium tetraurelia TaxID=5888 RepID=A0C335_PARTE|nr:uncharacterized protein GSPATT00034680001 [Paramecium tetraurelia]CAK65202.1 unnamed protein product [Paramecium tetraurelia]|eukprot:XP_001432599.1 hypothetical protein (macronuclear) [Paramecium tetraurelia strain d4-2]
MLTDTNRNKVSAYFPAALTLADLQNDQIMSEDSDVDLSQSKLQRLGIDMSSLHAPESSDKKDELSDVKTGLQEFNRSIQQYTKKFNESQSHQDRYNLSSNIEQFKQKIQELQVELQTDPPTSDPYKISLHSIRQTTDTKTPQTFTTNKQPNNQTQNQSYSSGAQSYQLPHLHSTNNKTVQNTRPDPFGNLSEKLEYHRIKYYDQFMPDNQKLLNNPLKYLKYKLDCQNRFNMEHCLDSLINY